MAPERPPPKSHAEITPMGVQNAPRWHQNSPEFSDFDPGVYPKRAKMSQPRDFPGKFRFPGSKLRYTNDYIIWRRLLHLSNLAAQNVGQKVRTLCAELCSPVRARNFQILRK